MGGSPNFSPGQDTGTAVFQNVSAAQVFRSSLKHLDHAARARFVFASGHGQLDGKRAGPTQASCPPQISRCSPLNTFPPPGNRNATRPHHTQTSPPRPRLGSRGFCHAPASPNTQAKPPRRFARRARNPRRLNVSPQPRGRRRRRGRGGRGL